MNGEHQRIVVQVLLKMGLSVSKGGEELGIAIGGKDECLGIRSFVCLDFVKGNGKTVNDGIVATGTLHRLQQDGQYIFAASIMMTKTLPRGNDELHQ